MKNWRGRELSESVTQTIDAITQALCDEYGPGWRFAEDQTGWEREDSVDEKQYPVRVTIMIATATYPCSSHAVLFARTLAKRCGSLGKDSHFHTTRIKMVMQEARELFSEVFGQESSANDGLSVYSLTRDSQLCREWKESLGETRPKFTGVTVSGLLSAQLGFVWEIEEDRRSWKATVGEHTLVARIEPDVINLREGVSGFTARVYQGETRSVQMSFSMSLRPHVTAFDEAYFACFGREP